MNVAAKIPVQQTTTALAPSRPLTVFGSLQREIDRVFEDFIPSFMPAFAGARGVGEVKAHMDLAETKDGLELTVELPGLEEKDVDVAIADGVLTVSGEKRFETERHDKNVHFSERSFGSFSRSIALPDGVSADKIKATLAKGVLKVAIPTPARSQPKKIAVQAST